MLDIKMRINGRPLRDSTIKSGLERALVEQIREHIRGQLKDVPNELDGKRLTVELVGTDLDNLSVRLMGPDELVAQARSALG